MGVKMIEINNLTKVYKLSKKQMAEQKTKKNMKKAADNISLSAKKGEIYGLLGPNGAGKTTTLRCVATLLKPTAGEIIVCGHDTVKEPEKVRESISFLTNEIKLDPQFSPKYMFNFFGRLHGMDEKTIDKRRELLFEHFGINDFQDKKIDELSTGMKQKASIAVSLVHDPEVVIFDEPTNGLDIVTARSVTDYLKILREEGKLVIVSTHIMSEAEKLCDRIGIIINGRKVMDGTLSEILTATGTDDLEDAFFELYKEHSKEEA
jgi:sodium transport system ATP-binding protein